MKALISPLEPTQDGVRVAQTDLNGFEVAKPLYWVDCPSNVVADQFYYKTDTQEFLPVPVPQPPAADTSSTSSASSSTTPA